MVTGYLRMTKVDILVVWDQKLVLVKYEKYATLSVHVGAE